MLHSLAISIPSFLLLTRVEKVTVLFTKQILSITLTSCDEPKSIGSRVSIPARCGE